MTNLTKLFIFCVLLAMPVGAEHSYQCKMMHWHSESFSKPSLMSYSFILKSTPSTDADNYRKKLNQYNTVTALGNNYVMATALHVKSNSEVAMFENVIFDGNKNDYGNQRAS